MKDKEPIARLVSNKDAKPAQAGDIAATLSEALPYLQRYDGKTVVIKFGGHAMGNALSAKAFARDIALIRQVGVNPIVVHGGGPQIGRMLERLQIPTEFIDGYRVTDKASMEIVEMVLAGSINKAIVADIAEAGALAVGLSGKDGGLIMAQKARRTKRDPESNIERILDLGFVGDPTDIDPTILDGLLESDLIPVIAPIGRGADGATYNINADTAAGAIASEMRAERLILLTDVEGVMDADKNVISSMSIDKAQSMIRDGSATGGMIPKLETCISAINAGVEAAAILDGRTPHAVLRELFTDSGAGTLIEGRN